nr:MAG TPA: hypothetical protein [Caudoviricetes sp.]
MNPVSESQIARLIFGNSPYCTCQCTKNFCL